MLILRQSLSDSWATALRAEYYRDRNEVIVGTFGNRGISTWGLSWNVDWQLSRNVLLRAEARYLRDRASIFETENARLRDDYTGRVTSVALNF